MLKALMKVRLAALLNWFTGGSRSKAKQSKGKLIGFAFLMIYALGTFGMLFWTYFSVMAEPFIALGIEWLYFSMAVIACFSIMFIGSVFFTKAQLYEAKDNELLLSMPIKPGSILFSRMAMLLLVNIIFGLPVAVPVAIVWCTQAEVTAYMIVAYVVVFLLLPLLALALSSFFGWLLSLATARVKNKALFGTVFSLVIMGAYFVVMMRMNNSLMEIAAHAETIASALSGIAPVYWAGSAIADGRWDYLILVCAIFIAAMAIAYFILSTTFIRAATTQHGAAKEKYVEKKSEAVTPKKALLRREFARLTSSSAYMVNSGLGIIGSVAGAVLLLVKRQAVLDFIGQTPSLELVFTGLLIILPCFINSMSLFSSASVSLDGRSLWIVKSMPVDLKDALNAKLKVHLYVCLPCVLLLSAACIIVAAPGVLDGLYMVLAPVASCFFVAELGLVENLRHPKLDWINETQAVKTGFGMLFTMLICWVVFAIPLVALFVLGPIGGFAFFIPVYTLVLALVCWLMYRWICGRGVAKYAAL